MCANRAPQPPTAIAVKFLGYTFIFCLKNMSKFQEKKDYKWQEKKKNKKKTKKKKKTVRNFTSCVRLVVRHNVISEVTFKRYIRP
jgi:hypothetical protein